QARDQQTRHKSCRHHTQLPSPSTNLILKPSVTQHHLRLRTEMLTATVARAEELKAEHSQRYRHLRSRITALVLVGFGAWTAVLVLLCRR
ncbi:hypothetical protein ACFWC9_40370, partial [Streptomyces goshikiensis]|uniref:hypothetical protein n=1 Tax=Streptomyces goshikiensis TaxID=1942 RepID=UPI0036A47E07